MKKLFSISAFILTFILSFCVFSGCREPNRYHDEQGFEYKYVIGSKTEFEISIGTCNENDIIIPSTFNGKPVTRIGNFKNDFLKSVQITDGVKVIGSSAFNGNISMEKVEIPDSVEVIEAGAFYNCRILANVYIPDGVSKIASKTFYGCEALKTIYLPSSVESIGNYAFEYCTNLTNVYLLDGLKNIGGNAFYFCGALESIQLPNTVETIGNNAFNFCTALSSIYIPENVKTMGFAIFNGCSSLKNIQVSVDNNVYKSIDGNLYSKDGKTFLEYAYGKEETVFALPDGVTSIGESAFLSKVLKNIEIPESVVNVAENAFGRYGALEYNVKDGLKYIGRKDNDYFILVGAESEDIENAVIDENCIFVAEFAFCDCSKLTSVKIPNGVKNVSSFMFANCDVLSSIEVPNSVISIGEGAFHNCDLLTEAIIGNGVTKIGKEAFYACRGVKDINYKGTMEQWKNIDVNELWELYVSATYVQCVDGQVSLTDN